MADILGFTKPHVLRNKEKYEGPRPLSIEQIGALRAHLGIPADLLIEADV